MTALPARRLLATFAHVPGVSAPVNVLLAVDRAGRVTDVHAPGDREMPSALADALRSVNVPWTPPDDYTTRILRRGTVTCAAEACQLELRATGKASEELPQ